MTKPIDDLPENLPPLSAQEKKEYLHDYQRGANLFQRALDEFSQSKNMFQKEEFKEVMDKALQAINEAAQALKQKELLQQNEKIAADYDAFKDEPSKENKEKLSHDLDKAQHFRHRMGS